MDDHVTDPFREYREAVARMIEHSRPWAEALGPDMSFRLDEAMLNDWIKSCVNQNDRRSPVDDLSSIWFHGEALPGSDWTRDGALAAWIAASEQDRQAWDGLQRLLQTLRKTDSPIPIRLLCWALDFAAGTHQPPPKRRGGDGRSHVYRDWAIVTAVAVLTKLGMPATVNPASDPESACHAVARATGMKYETVASVWKQHRRWMKRNSPEVNESV